jgi:hypothetical protein
MRLVHYYPCSAFLNLLSEQVLESRIKFDLIRSDKYIT